jgi:RNA polymerase sigma-70 factor (ECF subfamily)
MPEKLDINEIASTCFRRIHRAALVLSGSPWEADDLAQETFLVLSRQLDQFRGQSNIYTWLYGILLNLERGHRRLSARRQQKLRVLWDAESNAGKTLPASDADLETREWKRSLWSRVAELPDGQRHALMLRFSEQLHYDEIAEVLNCPLGTVKSRIFHGLAALRERMQSEFHDADQPTMNTAKINAEKFNTAKQASHVV